VAEKLLIPRDLVELLHLVELGSRDGDRNSGLIARRSLSVVIGKEGRKAGYIISEAVRKQPEGTSAESYPRYWFTWDISDAHFLLAEPFPES
jgi:hypothetical protein